MHLVVEAAVADRDAGHRQRVGIGPSLVTQWVEAGRPDVRWREATEIIGEFRQVQLAANTFWADTRSPPRFWTNKAQHPDLAEYLTGGSFPQPEGVGLEKY